MNYLIMFIQQLPFEPTILMGGKSGTDIKKNTIPIIFLKKVFERKESMEQIAKCKLPTVVFEADN